jgi:hypothetical protein
MLAMPEAIDQSFSGKREIDEIEHPPVTAP